MIKTLCALKKLETQPNMKARNGWFSRFKSRKWHNIAESGEAASTDKEAVSLYSEKL